MTNNPLNPLDFLYLQESVHDLERALKPFPVLDAVFPPVKGDTAGEDEKVELADVLTASLNAVDKATRNLRKQGIAFAREPIEINLTGSLVGISPDGGRIIIKVKPGG